MNGLWISDFTTEDHIGGAELTTRAILEAAPADLGIEQIHTHRIAASDLRTLHYDFIIVDSLTRIEDMPTFAEQVCEKHPFFSVEFDYNKVSPHRNLMYADCQYLRTPGLWGDFFRAFWGHRNHLHTFFMSEEQRSIHAEMIREFRKLDEAQWKAKSSILSSIFSKETLALIDLLNQNHPALAKEREGYLIYDTQNPLKGTEASLEYARQHGLTPVIPFADLSPDELLQTMVTARGLVYQPTLHDTCPRMVIEAFLLGCEIHINDLVQMCREDWFQSRVSARRYLEGRADYFWETVRQSWERQRRSADTPVILASG